MTVKLLNVVVLCENFEAQVKWYKETLNLEEVLNESGSYHYIELAFDKHVIVGLTPASEMKHKPTVPRNNSSLLQIEVTDMELLYEKVKKAEGNILFGPDLEDKYNFKYGAIADPEGNEIWVIEEMGN